MAGLNETGNLDFHRAGHIRSGKLTAAAGATYASVHPSGPQGYVDIAILEPCQ